MDRAQSVARPFWLSPLLFLHAMPLFTEFQSVLCRVPASIPAYLYLHICFCFMFASDTKYPPSSYPLLWPLTLTYPSGFRKPFLTHVRGLVCCLVSHNDLQHLLCLLINESLVVHVSMTLPTALLPALSIVASRRRLSADVC